MNNLPEEENPEPDRTQWTKVYALVLGWLLVFCLLMYLFTLVTE